MLDSTFSCELESLRVAFLSGHEKAADKRIKVSLNPLLDQPRGQEPMAAMLGWSHTPLCSVAEKFRMTTNALFKE